MILHLSVCRSVCQVQVVNKHLQLFGCCLPAPPLAYLLLVLAEEVDAGGAAEGQACGEEPGAQVNPVLLQQLGDGQPLSLHLL